MKPSRKWTTRADVLWKYTKQLIRNIFKLTILIKWEAQPESCASLLFQILLSLLQAFLSAFVDHFRNLSANPGKREKYKENDFEARREEHKKVSETEESESYDIDTEDITELVTEDEFLEKFKEWCLND